MRPTADNPQHILPGAGDTDGNGQLLLPCFSERVRALDQVVDVDYYVPGCPPLPKIITRAVATLLSEHLPEKGSVLAPDQACAPSARAKIPSRRRLRSTGSAGHRNCSSTTASACWRKGCSAWGRQHAQAARPHACTATCRVPAVVVRRAGARSGSEGAIGHCIAD